MNYLENVNTVGLPELRQNASALIGRVKAGEEITITVGGRAKARLVAAVPRTWRRWADMAELFASPPDPGWDNDREGIAHEVQDPWTK